MAEVNHDPFQVKPKVAHQDQVRLIFELCTTPDAAEYAREKIEVMLAGRLPEFMEEVHDYANNVSFNYMVLFSMDPVMQGLPPNELPPPIERAAINQVLKSEQQYPEDPALPVRMAFSIERQTGESFTGYDVNGGPPDDDTKKRLNDLFLRFLALKRVKPLSEGSNLLVQCDDNNQHIGTDDKPAIVDAEALKQQIMDDESGFHAFIEQYGRGLNITQIMITKPPSELAKAQSKQSEAKAAATEEKPKQDQQQDQQKETPENDQAAAPE